MRSAHAMRHAARVLRRGGIVAHPTEGVFGLAASALDPDAITRVLTLKGRDPRAGFIVLLADTAGLEALVELPAEPAQREAVLASWPGPETWILPAAADVPAWLTGGRETLAVRVTAHPVAAALCRAAGEPLVSTSANPSGLAPALDALRVRRYFGRGVDFILGGRPPRPGRATRIRAAHSGAILRR